METNYFTCTLGQATEHQDGKCYNNIIEFISHKVRSSPKTSAVGFYEVIEKVSSQWRPHVLTFKQIESGITTFALEIEKHTSIERRQTVALMCPSSAHFLFTWLALIWLGHPALLIAPQCSPSAIAQLCKSCEVKYLLYDGTYHELATNAVTESSKMEDASMNALPLPFDRKDVFDVIKLSVDKRRAFPASLDVIETDVAYLHHTSGTSSGIPKPIPQTHKAAVGVLPTTLKGKGNATFTTTPLYHGGIADLFRAWTSDAMIWLFPSKEIPITAANVCKCLDIASNSADEEPSLRVKYFSSVPYVLQMMAESKDGLRQLKKLAIVGVGGAALPTEVGDSLVNNSVNLISRFGSAECGFLMSSHRDYAKDKGWQYLRSAPGREQLCFEPRGEGLYELVIQRGWPHMAKSNREDGAYVTSDLFVPHAKIPNAWRYHSRADSQLTLVTGKKFDPAPIEDAIRASLSSRLEDVLIFGTGMPYPGALLFRTSESINVPDEELVAGVAPVVENLNRASQGHARIPHNMLIPMPHLKVKLEKSSKGTILRNEAEQRFAAKIVAAYGSTLSNGVQTTDIPDAGIPKAIREIVLKVLEQGKTQGGNAAEEDLLDGTDLFSYGVDSVACIQIRRGLLNMTPEGSSLPMTVVQDAGTISRLSEVVLRMRSCNGCDVSETATRDGDGQQHQLMLDLVHEYSKFATSKAFPPLAETSTSSSSTSPRRNDTGTHVLLTGPTGSLGAHLLSQLLCTDSISKIHLLIRGATPTACRERVVKAMSSRTLTIPASFETKVQIHSCKLSEPNLGLSVETYNHLAETVDTIVHLAWSVNFLWPLRSFASTHLAGLRNLLNFALSSPPSSSSPSSAQNGKRQVPPRFIFCSSVAAVSRSIEDIIPERILSHPSTAGRTGYARSKWVAEQVCQAAHDGTRLKTRISIARVGQLSGATDTGAWNGSEAYPLMLSSVKCTGGLLPDLDAARRAQGQRAGEVLGWLPVDVAARAFVEEIVGHVSRHEKNEGEGDGGMQVHHVLNPAGHVTWSTLLGWLSRRDDIKVVPVEEWLARLEDFATAAATQHRNGKDSTANIHPAIKLLGFWKDAYCTRAETATGQEDKDERDGNNGPQCYTMARTYSHMPTLRNVDVLVTEEYGLKVWNWIQESVS